MSGFVYILANRKNGTLYTGVTNDIVRRTQEHKEEIEKGFTQRYAVKKLVWYEHFERFDEAISFEKRIKRWRRDWKIQLIEKMNPTWNDLFREITH
ncbi:MAG TPA: excinuclease ABC subunit C [Rhodospirillaceae bacterium]|nr:excinuclease ABC subunit C [Rhodospirillaceae bacterium]